MKKTISWIITDGVLAALVALTLLLAATLPVYAHGGDLAADGCHRVSPDKPNIGLRHCHDRPGLGGGTPTRAGTTNPCSQTPGTVYSGDKPCTADTGDEATLKTIGIAGGVLFALWAISKAMDASSDPTLGIFDPVDPAPPAVRIESSGDYIGVVFEHSFQ